MGFLTKLPNLSRTCIFLRFLPKQQPQYTFKTLQITQRKMISSRFVRQDTANTFKMQDKIPEHYELIYRIKLAKYIYWGQIMSTVLVGIVMVAYIYSESPKTINDSDENWFQTLPKLNEEQIVYFSAFAGLYVIFNMLIARLPVRMYYYKKQKDYVAVYYGSILNKIKKIHFQQSDISKLPESGLLPWKNDWYRIKNKHNAILFETSFRTPADQNILLGYLKDDDEDE